MSYIEEQRSAPPLLRVVSNKDRYWPEIDGLRTIAVMSVFIFHLDARLLGGGFVGVDIFFVISGYLITNLLVKDIEGGKFSILRFYQRRIARIAPAALLVVAITMIGGFFLYSAQDFASLGAAGLAATLSFINIKLLFQGSYFKISPDAQPLIHYWSLAVEEQFYVVFPLLLYCVMRLTRHSLAVLSLCFALSFAACVFFTPVAPIASFYLLPTRAWELLAGSCLAIARRQYPKFPDRNSSLYLVTGLIFILLSFVLVRSEGFPGWIAMLPVVGSTVLLAGIGTSHRGAIHRSLAHPVMVFIGKRSYSLYLWHWPTFSFVDYYFYLSSPAVGLVLKIVISGAATILTYHFVERPMRSWLNKPQRRVATFGAFAVAAMMLGIAGYVIRSNYYLTAESRNVATGGISVNPEGRGWVVVIGDSQGAMYGFELASLARTLGFRLNVLSAAAGNELPGEPDTLWPKVSQFLGDSKPDIVVLAQAWSSKLGEDGESHFGDAMAALTDRAAQIIVLTQPPEPPPEVSRHAILAGARPPFLKTL
ncbi:MAG: acyltransferase family protein [Methylocystis sp.]|uniref:acyltransferase family protein n=1 Tax=Methylocystis sp. TaxID=1911079 RepID=UPI003DA20840